MPILDLQEGYKDAQSKINSYKVYRDAKLQYTKTKKRAGSAFEEKKSNLTKQINKSSSNTTNQVKNVKTQFDHLIDLVKTTSSSVGNNNSIKYVKSKFLLSLKNIEPKITEILFDESLIAVGCDQNQGYQSGQKIYVKVSTIDLPRLLKVNPQDNIGKSLYEKSDVTNPQSTPYPMNRELYNRIQSSNDYTTDYGDDYRGASGNNLFNIKFIESHPVTNEGGGWYEVTLSNRPSSFNSVKEFIVDYYQSIKMFERQNTMAWIMESLTGAVTMNIKSGDSKIDDMSKFMLFIQRIMGLCFDNNSEIDVNSSSKISESDNVDDSFFELSEIDLRNINLRLQNIKKGVATFESCDNIELPINFLGLSNDLEKITFVKDEDFVKNAENLTNNVIDKTNEGIGIEVNVDEDFVKSIIKGLVLSIFSPKVLLPLFVMMESLKQGATNGITSFTEFVKKFRKYVKRVISKIAALFVKELFNIIKKDIIALVRPILSDLVRERMGKKMKMILKLVQLLAFLAKLVNDWRQCKSVIDEILSLLNLARGRSFGNSVPLPLLFASNLLDGYSETRAFISTIEDLEKLGIPTGAMPDGSPNLTVLSMYSQMKSMANEEAENGKVQIAIPPLTITPAGVTIPLSAYGKKL
jgi:hypothetical protein